MITRFRLEAEAENEENVEDKLEAASQAMFGFLADTQPEDEWELTDGPIFPAISEDGTAVMFGRRVYRRKVTNVGY